MNRGTLSTVAVPFLSASLALLALQGRPALAQDEQPASRPDFSEIRRTLDLGYWNARIEALYQLEQSGPGAVPLWSYASQDADWQVRHAAVHFLGQAGPAAAPALAALIKVEACPDVRLAALKWLSNMGEPARQFYAQAATPMDEALLSENPYRYGSEHMGKPLVIDSPPGGMTKGFFEGGQDLRVCASSERSGHHDDTALEQETAALSSAASEERRQDFGAPQSLLPVPAPAARRAAAPSVSETPRQKRLNAELDALLAMEPETFPAIDPLPEHPPAARDELSLRMPQRPALAMAGIRAGRGEAEGFAAIAPLPERETEAASADLEDDAGTGRAEFDRIPVLIERLSSPDAGRRALAAELLGKRGPEAFAAVPALRRALKDPERRVRASAALALGDVGASGRGVRSDLKRALRDKSEDVRSSAWLALKMIESPR